MSTAMVCVRLVRCSQISAAARPAAAIETCAAVPTRNDDGNAGSAPVNLTRSNPVSSPPLPRQSERKICAGVELSSYRSDVMASHPRLCADCSLLRLACGPACDPVGQVEANTDQVAEHLIELCHIGRPQRRAQDRLDVGTQMID